MAGYALASLCVEKRYCQHCGDRHGAAAYNAVAEVSMGNSKISRMTEIPEKAGACGDFCSACQWNKRGRHITAYLYLYQEHRGRAA